LPVPSSYITSGPDTLEFLSWHEDQSQSLAGQLQTAKASAGQVAMFSLGFTGKLAQGAVSLNFGAVVLTGSFHHQRLLLNGDGLWVPATQTDYQGLLKAFQVHQALRGTLINLSQLIQDLPTDSDPSTANFQVIGVKQSVDTLATFWASVQEIPTHAGQCQTLNEQLSLYYPLRDAIFQMRIHPEKSQLAGVLSAEQEASHRAKGVSVPHVSGLTLPWLVTANEESQATQIPTAFFTKLKLAAEQGQKQLDQQHARYLGIVPEIEAMQMSCV
jgi:hypothetical protein